ncbi:MAG TPA: Rrf2 family transcriptional regulator [candidate division Zixibacteria bacterium]|nr:Rrf2 family transcriptional regulator [candidate division Zixibacteria bacterium]
MLFSQPTTYAIMALCLMNREYHGAIVKSRELAVTLGIHEAYLSKVLSRLAQKGLVQSHRGPSGGFQLTADPTTISLGDILAACDDLESLTTGCVMGMTECNESALCSWHDIWKQFREDASDIIRRVTLNELGELMERRFPGAIVGRQYTAQIFTPFRR